MSNLKVRVPRNARTERHAPWWERLLALIFGLGFLYGAFHAAMAGSLFWTLVAILCAINSFVLASQKFWRMR